uniref:Uncharacterized protein n=1 Tax=Oryza rufipogon TaxID=4529 RepID=A0A0E0N503_ORYRU
MIRNGGTRESSDRLALLRPSKCLTARTDQYPTGHSSLRRRRKGKNSMVLTSSCSRSICSQALPVVFLSYFVYGFSVCRECVWPIGP